MSETTAAIPAPTRSKKKNLLMIGAGAAIVIAIGGGAAFWWSQRAEAQSVEQPAAETVDHNEERGMVSFEPFVVNLADTTASRFLRVKVQLIVADAEQAEEFEKSAVKLSRARSAILEMLTTQKSEVLVTPEGKAELRKAIAEGLGKSLHVEIIDVLFSDFVVQF